MLFNIMSMKNLIELLIEKFGTTGAIAKELEVKPQVVSNWRKRGMSSKAAVNLLMQRPNLLPQLQNKSDKQQ